MPPKVSETAAAKLPVIGVASLLALITTSAAVETVFALNKGGPIADPPTAPTTTSSDGPPSELSDDYPEMTALREGGVTVIRAATHLTTAVDPKELLSRRIRSIPYEGHDRPSSTPPTKAAVDDALRFADLLPAGSPAPHVSVADDGEINFFRRQEGLFIDVGFFGDDQIHYYVQVEASGLDVADSCPFDGESLPRELIVALTTE